MSAKCRLINPFIAAIIAAGLVFTQGRTTPVQAVSITLVISQFQVSGASALDEFIEIHNVSGSSINLNGYKLVYRNESGTSDYLLVTFDAITLPAGGYYLAANSGYDEEGIPNDVSYVIGLAASGAGIAIRDAQDQIVDSLGYGTVNNIFIEGTKTTAPSINQSLARSGNGCTDTDNNANDFLVINPSSPRNSSSPDFLCVPLDIAPAVISTQPSNGAEDVLPGADINLVFSEPVTIIPEIFFDLTCDSVERPGTISGSGSTYTLDPSAELPYGATCDVSIYASAVRDQDGILQDQMAADYVFSFNTLTPDPAPVVTAVFPLSDATGIALDSNLSVEFNEPVTVAAGWYDITCVLSGEHMADISGGPASYLLNPEIDFARDELCTVILEHTLVTDQDLDDPFDAMAEDYTWSFTTLPPDVAPMITSVLPLNNSSVVALDSDITVVFSEPVTVEPGWFNIACTRSGVHAGSAMGDTTQTSYVILPEAIFSLDEICTVTVYQASVHDRDSDDPPDGMDSDYIWSFNTLSPSFYIYCSLIMTSH